MTTPASGSRLASTHHGGGLQPESPRPARANGAPTQCAATWHGTRDAYIRAHCRCPEARTAANRYHKQHRLRKIRGESLHIDATGTNRRIRALQRQGWTAEILGARLGGVTVARVCHMATCPKVHVDTARAVAALYAELAEQPGPSEKLRRRAETFGWLGPGWFDADNIDDPTYEPPVVERRHWSDVDTVAVQRAVSGSQVCLTRAERRRAVWELHDAGMAHLAIARQLHITNRQVLRDVAERGKGEWVA